MLYGDIGASAKLQVPHNCGLQSTCIRSAALHHLRCLGLALSSQLCFVDYLLWSFFVRRRTSFAAHDSHRLLYVPSHIPKLFNSFVRKLKSCTRTGQIALVVWLFAGVSDSVWYGSQFLLKSLRSQQWRRHDTVCSYPTLFHDASGVWRSAHCSMVLFRHTSVCTSLYDSVSFFSTFAFLVDSFNTNVFVHTQ